MKRGAVLVLFCAAAFAARGADAPQAGVTIMGDQDSALGLFLAPWKEESAAELGRPPAMSDPQPVAVDAQAYLRTHTYYETGRAYRRERLQRNQ